MDGFVEVPASSMVRGLNRVIDQLNRDLTHAILNRRKVTFEAVRHEFSHCGGVRNVRKNELAGAQFLQSPPRKLTLPAAKAAASAAVLRKIARTYSSIRDLLPARERKDAADPNKPFLSMLDWIQSNSTNLGGNLRQVALPSGSQGAISRLLRCEN